VSNNVGIDFTELGPSYGTKPGSAAPKEQGSNEKASELITIGFRVNRMYNEFVVDPNTKEPENVRLSLQETCDQTCN
jgi:hypothetical protein